MVDQPHSSPAELYEPMIARLHQAAQPYAACVVPILGRGGRTQYASKGSGVLLGTYRPQFLLSATHVLEESRKGGVLRMGLGSRVITLAGRFAATEAYGPGALDVGVCVFNESSLDFSEVGWISPGEVQSDSASRTSTLHVVIGFPHTKQASRPINGVLELNAMIHWGRDFNPEQVTAFGYDPSTQLLVEFDKNDITGPRGVTTSADPYGVSGGGVWSSPRPFEEGQGPWKLAGVAIEWREGREKAVLATRVQHALEVISMKSATVAPALSPFIR
jgi:hypothetical protein